MKQGKKKIHFARALTPRDLGVRYGSKITQQKYPKEEMTLGLLLLDELNGGTMKSEMLSPNIKIPNIYKLKKQITLY